MTYQGMGNLKLHFTSAYPQKLILAHTVLVHNHQLFK